MNILEKINNLIEAVQPFEVVSNDKIFAKMANFPTV